MSYRYKTMPVLLITLCLLIIGMFLYKYLKQEEYTYFTPAKAEARYNQYLAAEMLLEKYNLNVETFKQFSPETYPEKNIESAAFISTSKIYQQQAVLRQLLRWVGEGGYLILPGPVINRFNNNEGNFNNLIPGTDIKFEYLKSTDNDTETEESIFEINNKKYELAIKSDLLISTEQPVQWLIEDEQGMYAAAIQIGEGTLVIFSHLNLFSNQKIALNDHAQLFLDIFSRLNTSADIINVNHILNPQSPGIIDVVLNYPYVLTLVIAIVLMFFWLNWGYFGPLYDKISLTRVTLYSHLLFSGQYLWRHVSIDILYKIVFAEFESTLNRHCHGWHQKSNIEKINYIVEATGMLEADVASFINYQPSKNKNRYLIFCKQSRLIRNKL